MVNCLIFGARVHPNDRNKQKWKVFFFSFRGYWIANISYGSVPHVLFVIHCCCYTNILLQCLFIFDSRIRGITAFHLFFFLFAVGIILLLLKIFWNRLFNAMKQKPFVQFIQCLAMHLNALFYIILHRLYYTTYQTGSDPLLQYHIRIKCVRGTYNIFHWNNIRQFMCDFLTA